jgi:subfamily B ATP-binding cassette protein MsbA
LSDLGRLGSYVGRHRWALTAAVASSIIASVFLGGSVSMLRDLFEALTVEDPAAVVQTVDVTDEAAGEKAGIVPAPLARSWDSLRARWQPFRLWLLERGWVRVPMFIVLLYLLKGLFGYLAVYGVRRVGLKTVARMRADLYSRAIAQSDDYYRSSSTGDVLSRITLDVARLQSLFQTDFAQAVVSVPIVIVMLTVAIMFAWQVALACLVIIPVFAIVVGRLGQRIKKAARRSQERAAGLASLIEETLLARRIVQAFGAEKYESGRFHERQRRMLREDFRIARTVAVSSPLIELVSGVFGAALIIYAGSLIRSGVVDGKNVFVVVATLFVAFTNIRRLGQLNNAVQQALASARRIFEMLDAPNKIMDRPDAPDLPLFRSELRLENVSYTYGRGPVLRGISLTIGAGETHALVGGSGAGKSTLASLLPRFIDPTEGRVLVDGHDLRDVSLASIRQQIAYVSQDTHLFDDSVVANIAYGRSDVTEEQIRAAARAAHAEEFIERLPEGYQTPLGERGSRLSAGQRQRIAIARAFLREARILILDEATSALDSESEHMVQTALEDLRRGRTALVIAHRLSTIAGADVIHVLEAGSIVESGRYEELLRKGGRFARLSSLQERT